MDSKRLQSSFYAGREDVEAIRYCRIQGARKSLHDDESRFLQALQQVRIDNMYFKISYYFQSMLRIFGHSVDRCNLA